MATFFNNISIIELLISSGYLIALFLSLAISIRTDNLAKDKILSHRLFFFSITLIIIVLLITQLTNLNTKIAESVRYMAKHHGWYRDRYDFQILILSIVSVAAIISLILIDRFRLSVFRAYRLTVSGLFFLIFYTIVSSISYHPIDQLLNLEFGKTKLSFFIELMGVTWITISLFVDFTGFLKNKIVVKKKSEVRYI